MKTLTIRQPYVHAILSGLKQYETRSWKTNYRGKLLIHAGCAKMTPVLLDLANKYGFQNIITGAILLECELVDCILITKEFRQQQTQAEFDFGDWTTGRYAWKLINIKPIPTPIKTTGQLGLWNFEL